MSFTGNLRKMQTKIKEENVHYELHLGGHSLMMNESIGKPIQLQFTGIINCMHCGKKTPKSYAQGYCYSCFASLPQTDVGVVSPEKDLSYIGISRDMEWAEKNSLILHYVYLSLTDKVKVGVTRHTQIPTRWIDQGASQAIILAETPNRHIAGVIEVFLKQYFADKTSWQKMLTQSVQPEVDLHAEKQKARELLHPELRQYVLEKAEVLPINYPMLKIPEKVKSLKLDKTTSSFAKKLVGIKGQYFLFDDNTVFNVRNHAGYEVVVTL